MKPTPVRSGHKITSWDALPEKYFPKKEDNKEPTLYDALKDSEAPKMPLDKAHKKA